MDTKPIQTRAVARFLDYSEAYVRRLDQALEPRRTASGTRLYDPVKVAQYGAELDARRAISRRADRS